MTKILERIVRNPGILGGKPIIRGSRLSVELIIGLLADGWTLDDLMKDYPGLEVEDVRACLTYAHEVLVAKETKRPRKSLSDAA